MIKSKNHSKRLHLLPFTLSKEEWRNPRQLRRCGFLPPPAGIEDGAKVVQSADASYLDGMVDAAIVAAAKALVESGATVEALDRGEDDGEMMRSTIISEK